MESGKTLGRLMGCAAHLARERLEARLSDHEITPAQVHVLLYLLRHGGEASQRELGEVFKVKPPTMKGILDRMEEKDLVRRRVSPEDGRRRQVLLTQRGAEKEELFRKQIQQFEGTLTQGFSQEERTLFRAFLGRVIQNLEEDRRE